MLVGERRIYRLDRRQFQCMYLPQTLHASTDIASLGNIHQIPKKGAHFQFAKWAKQYGGIYTLKLGTGTAAVLTSPRLVKQLIDKKSSIYNERPKSYVANLISGGDHILLMDYGQQWRGTRKLLHGTFMEKVVEEQHVQVQEAEAAQMLRDYLINPQDHMLHPKRYSNSITMSIVWGVRTPTPQTKHMERYVTIPFPLMLASPRLSTIRHVADRQYFRLYSLMEIWSKVMETGATPPVDIYPFLHWLPQSIFLNWVDRATHVQKEMNHLYADFLTDIRMRRSKEGTGRGAFMDKVLDQADGDAKKQDGLTYSDHELWFMGGTLTEGGSDTSASIITAFVQAMVRISRDEASDTFADYNRSRTPKSKRKHSNRSTKWLERTEVPTGRTTPNCHT